jgi:2-aminoadipate transaminase
LNLYGGMVSYDFARGHPNAALVPLEPVKALLTSIGRDERDQDALADDQLRRALNYGREEGEIKVVEALVDFLSRQCQHDETPSRATLLPLMPSRNYFVTGGVSHGLELIAAVTTQPGDVVWTERPTYYLVAGIFHSHGLSVENVPTHDLRVDVDRMERELSDGTRSPPRLLYLIPTHQNPTGQSLTLKQRQKLVTLAHHYKFLIVADEVYHLLDWRNPETDLPRPCRMAVLHPEAFPDTEGQDSDCSPQTIYGCCSVSSFTKIYAPGVRCGWIEADENLIRAVRRYGYVRSQGGFQPLVGEIMRRALITLQVDQVLQCLCDAYQTRSRSLCDILSTPLTTPSDNKIEFPYGRPLGGYFLWIRLPCLAQPFLKYCAPDLQFMLGTLCDAADQKIGSPHRDELKFCARLCFADMDTVKLRAGAELLVAKLQTYLAISI